MLEKSLTEHFGAAIKNVLEASKLLRYIGDGECRIKDSRKIK